MDVPVVLLTAALGVALGFLLGKARAQREHALLRDEAQRAREETAGLRERVVAQDETHPRALVAAEARFQALAAEALKANSEEFLRLASTRLGQATQTHASELDKQRQAVESVVRPLAEKLKELTLHAQDLESKRVVAYAEIRGQYERLGQATQQLHDQSTALSNALRGSSQARGMWGEMALRNIAELAGMTEHCDFLVQAVDDAGQRPDMVVLLPGEGRIPVDAKAPFSHYLEACDATDPGRRDALLDQHAAALRRRVRELKTRGYSRTVGTSVDFTILFVPAEPMLSAAFQRDPGLHEEAVRDGILLVTPASLVALLRTVGLYWRQERLTENAQRVVTAANELYDRVAKFGEHLGGVGRSLAAATGSYNDAVGSFQHRVLPAGRRLQELGVGGDAARKIEDLPSVDGPGRYGERSPAEEPAETASADRVS